MTSISLLGGERKEATTIPTAGVRHMSMRTDFGAVEGGLRRRPGARRLLARDTAHEGDDAGTIAASSCLAQGGPISAEKPCRTSSARVVGGTTADDDDHDCLLARAVETVISARLGEDDDGAGAGGRDSHKNGPSTTTAAASVLDYSRDDDRPAAGIDDAGAAAAASAFDRIRDGIARGDLSASEAVSFLEGYLLPDDDSRDDDDRPPGGIDDAGNATARKGDAAASASFDHVRAGIARGGDPSASEAVSFLDGYLQRNAEAEAMRRKMAEMERELRSLRRESRGSAALNNAAPSCVSTSSGGIGGNDCEEGSLRDSAGRVDDLPRRIGTVTAPATFSGGAARFPLLTIQEDESVECNGNGNGSGNGLTSVDNLRDTLQRSKQKVINQSCGVPPRRNLKDTLYDSKKKSGKGEFINQSCKTLSMKRILNDPNVSPETERVLRELMEVERKRDKLEKQLQQAGITIAEDIPYEEAKRKVQEIGKRMGEIGSSQVEHEDKLVQAKLREEYFRLEQDMEKYNNALMLTDEYIKEQEDKEREWEETNREANLEALKKIRRHMPVEIKNTSEAQLSSQATPNGKVLPKDIAKKFKRTDVLMLLRTNPDDIERVHPSTLENLRVTGLTLTERRAIHEHLRGIGERWKKNKAEKMTERKWTWFNTMRENFKENLAQYDRHVGQYGPPGDHPYATRKDPNVGCPLIGRQCPLRADKNPSYDDDYGYPDGAEYVESFVTKADAEDSGAKAQREAQELARAKKATARQDELKKHYKGKILEVSKANGSCEAMDEAMDRIESRQIGWIEARVADASLDGKNVDDSGRRKETAEFNDALNELKLSVLQFAEKSGMQLTGRKDASADKGDNRSAIELGLSEEVYGASMDFIKGIEERMEKIKAVDSLMKSSIKQLRELLEELHGRSLNTLKKLGCEKPAPSRKWKSREDLLKEAKEKLAPEEEAAEEVVEDYAAPPVPPVGGRGGLMDEIAGRGRGGGGGRGDLLGAIAARGGRGRGGRDAGGRGDLLGAIAARGRGGGGRDAGGRGDLLGAIAARGRGGAGRDAGGRADLLGAIAARGRGGGGRDAGGRADLLGAIAARGGAARGGGGRDTGRADLLGAIAARGRNGGGRGGNGRSTRGGLMAEIAARGRAGERGGRGGGARGGLMAEIAARGRAAERGGSGRSTRGGLMAEIAARGRAGERGGRGRSARGGLMAEIAARGA